MRTAFFYGLKKVATKIAFIFALSLVLIAIPVVATAQNRGGGGGSGTGGGGNGGGGGGGDAFITYITYSAATCPVPAEVRNDYGSFLFCGLGKMSRDPNNFLLLVDGYTNLLPGTTKTVNTAVPVTLPCGNVVTLTRYNEVAFAQTSPPPPPYRLQTSTTKVTDTCPH